MTLHPVDRWCSKGFRLGSGARSPGPGSTPSSLCAGTIKRWLLIGAILFAVVEANSNGANNPSGSSTPLMAAMKIFAKESGPLTASGDDHFSLRRNAKLKGTTISGEEQDVSTHALPETTHVKVTITPREPQLSRRRLSVILTALWTLTCFACIAYMHPGPNNNDMGGNSTRGPRWDPNGNISFREWVTELQPWLSITSYRMGPAAQAAAMQMGLQGIARAFALQIPAASMTYGAQINGVPVDPVTYLLYLLSNRFEQLEDERTIELGNSVLDFRAVPREPIDHLLIRWDLARARSESVGAGWTNPYHLTTILLRQLQLTVEQTVTLLQPLGGHLPNTLQQYDDLVIRIRAMGHIVEGSRGNIAHALTSRHHAGIAITDVVPEQMYHANAQQEAPTTTNNYASWYQDHRAQPQ